MNCLLICVVACLGCEEPKVIKVVPPNLLPPILITSLDGDVNGDGKTTIEDLSALEDADGFLEAFSLRLAEKQKIRFPTSKPRYPAEGKELKSLANAMIRQLLEAEGKIVVLTYYGGGMNHSWISIDTNTLKAIRARKKSFVLGNLTQRWSLVESMMPVSLTKPTA